MGSEHLRGLMSQRVGGISPEDRSLNVEKKALLPPAISAAIAAYEEVYGINSLGNYTDGRMELKSWEHYAGTLVDWYTWYSPEKLEDLYHFCVEFGYTEAAYEIEVHLMSTMMSPDVL